MECERAFSVEVQRLGGDGGGDVGVPVTIAADPRSESKRLARVGINGGIALLKCAPQLAAQLRHDVPQCLLEVVQAVPDFVEHGGGGVAYLDGKPQRGDLL